MCIVDTSLPSHRPLLARFTLAQVEQNIIDVAGTEGEAWTELLPFTLCKKRKGPQGQRLPAERTVGFGPWYLPPFVDAEDSRLLGHLDGEWVFRENKSFTVDPWGGAPAVKAEAARCVLEARSFGFADPLEYATLRHHLRVQGHMKLFPVSLHSWLYLSDC